MKILIIGENNFNFLEKIFRKNFLILKCSKVRIYSFWKPKNYIFQKFLNFQEKYVYFLYCFFQNLILNKKLKRDSGVYDFVLVFNGYHLDKKTIENIQKKTNK